MPIVRRAETRIAKVIFRWYRMDGETRIITKQVIDEVRMRMINDTPHILFSGIWLEVDPIDAETRGGCEYEVYSPDIDPSP